ncbi:unnamed protein product [Adineta steineri]|uniref:Uncharacterized protein n=2 Tax=Adineta steineri TaxID=433720 RepID=A0A819WW06_9BILA|nr:unnamed protein product [Adineta steineri]CAF4132710.1 unnamed protein product [Adineta steineri]
MMADDEHSFRRNNSEQNLIFKYRFTPTYRRLCLFIIVIIFICISLLNYNSIFKYKENLSSKLTIKSSIPTLARILYLFICENQAEVDAYIQIFPSVTADAIFYCWRENCNSSSFRSSLHLYINTWSSKTKRNEKLISFQPISSFHYIQSRIFIINEKELNPKQKLTWTTARNKLYEVALDEERNQNWRWSYYTFADGDVHVACPLAEQLLTNKTIVDYGNNEEYLLAPHFYSFINLTQNLTGEDKCFLLHDAFLFSISPAVATITGSNGPMAFPGLLTQVLYHIDAMFNAIHRDALPFLLPYCPRYDAQSWWTSQAIFVYRSLCLYGHVIGFDGIHLVTRKHRAYPRAGNPWAIDNDMNLVPDYLLRLKNYMQQSRFVSALVLHNYAGWNLELTSETCRSNHAAMKLDTCLVYGNS